MLETRGHVSRRLASLVLEAREVPAPDTAVTDPGGVPIGQIKSAILSPTLERVVAFAMIKRAHAEPGKTMLVGDRISARVVERPA